MTEERRQFRLDFLAIIAESLDVLLKKRVITEKQAFEIQSTMVARVCTGVGEDYKNEVC